MSFDFYVKVREAMYGNNSVFVGGVGVFEMVVAGGGRVCQKSLRLRQVLVENKRSLSQIHSQFQN